MEQKKPLTEQEREEYFLEVVNSLRDMPFSTLVRIGCALNVNEWPEELPGKPEGWDEMNDGERTDWSMPIWLYVRSQVGDKAMLRHSHKTEFGRTDQEFEDWWESCHIHVARDVSDQAQKQCQSGNTERYERSSSQEFVVPFFLGANVGIFLVTLLLNVLKIFGVL